MSLSLMEVEQYPYFAEMGRSKYTMETGIHFPYIVMTPNPATARPPSHYLYVLTT
jgi:hypothetical protein